MSNLVRRCAVASISANGAAIEVEGLSAILGVGGKVACACNVFALDESSVVEVQGSVVALAKTLLHGVFVAPAGPVLVDGPVGVFEFKIVASVAVCAVQIGNMVVNVVGLFKK